MSAAIQFATTQDGVRIAYRTIGGGHPLIFVRGWISHLEVLGVESYSRGFFEALGAIRTLIQYDARGNGLSDRDVEDLTIDAFVLDLESLVDRLGLETLDLYGQCFGGPIAVAYAVKHPEKVSSLILDGSYARGHEITTPERQAALLGAIRAFWSATAHVLDHLTAPDSEGYSGAATSTRQAISGETAARLYEMAYRTDITDLLPRLTMPTLVLHRRGSQSIPFHLGRELASLIPDARFVPLEGTAHNPWGGDTARLLENVTEFLVGRPTPREAPAPEPTRAGSSITILFTDMEGSTPLTQRVGDAAAQELVRVHNTIVREALMAHGGSQIKHTGDGIMASFPAASYALECAIAIQREFARHNESRPESRMEIRIGLNAGEPVAEEQDLFGTAVQLAARVCGHAAPGQILASNVVRELVAGKGFLFSDQGGVSLRGFEDPVRLYEVSWQT